MLKTIRERRFISFSGLWAKSLVALFFIFQGTPLWAQSARTQSVKPDWTAAICAGPVLAVFLVGLWFFSHDEKTEEELRREAGAE